MTRNECVRTSVLLYPTPPTSTHPPTHSPVLPEGNQDTKYRPMKMNASVPPPSPPLPPPPPPPTSIMYPPILPEGNQDTKYRPMMRNASVPLPVLYSS